MQAIILAAGMGKRLGELTRENTKCMVKVGGVSLIERALKILDKKGLSRIIIVAGYQRENLMSFVKTLDIHTPIQFIINDVYDKTNNIFSLSMAKDYLVSEDTLLLESDLIFEECLIDLLLNDERDTLALVDKFESWMDGSCIVVDEMDNMTDFIPGKLLKFSDKEHYYKTVNIYKFGAEFSSQVYVPFEIKRVYYMYDTKKDVHRGFHAHKSLEQILICIHGSCKVLLDNGTEKKIVSLEKPYEGLYIANNMWREMYDFSEDAVLMVLASEYYKEEDYIRDYNEFLRMVGVEK